MTISGKIEHTRSVSVTPERMRALYDIISSHCEELKISAKTVQNRTLHCDSLDELLLYNNLKSNKIVSVEIQGCGKYPQIVDVEIGTINNSTIRNYESIVRCSYNISANNDVDGFVLNFEQWCQSATTWHWWLGKYSIKCLVGIFAVFRFLCDKELRVDLISGQIQGGALLSTISFAILLSIAIFLLYLTYLFDTHFSGKFFPPVTFLWGGEQERNKKRCALLSKSFWKSVSPILLGLAGCGIYDILKGLICYVRAYIINNF